MTRDQLREHLDRDLTSPPPWVERCGSSPPHWWRRRVLPAWHSWFDGEHYLGEVSARTGPDAVPAVQPCGCGQCSAAKEP